MRDRFDLLGLHGRGSGDDADGRIGVGLLRSQGLLVLHRGQWRRSRAERRERNRRGILLVRLDGGSRGRGSVLFVRDGRNRHRRGGLLLHRLTRNDRGRW
uniref:(northern house mosquito) hypothetical protein n=1 Tax=Culex pipiens TaxID=7175 RepID=A0A8D8DR85_CULPI